MYESHAWAPVTSCLLLSLAVVRNLTSKHSTIATMKAILQRVLSASVTVDKQIVSAIGGGVLVLAAVGKNDTPKDAESMAAKVLKLKLWPDDTGAEWKKSVQEIDGEVLCVSQFTLMASTRKGNKPDLHEAAKPELAKELYEHFFATVKSLHSAEKVKDGVFQAMMEVALVNDGPVTLEVDTSLSRKKPADNSDDTEVS